MFAYVGKTGYEDGLSMKDGHWGSGRYISMKYANGDIESCEALGLRRFSTTAIVVGKDQRVAILSADSILEVRVDYRATKDAKSSCPSVNCDSTGCSR